MPRKGERGRLRGRGKRARGPLPQGKQRRNTSDKAHGREIRGNLSADGRRPAGGTERCKRVPGENDPRRGHAGDRGLCDLEHAADGGGGQKADRAAPGAGARRTPSEPAEGHAAADQRELRGWRHPADADLRMGEPTAGREAGGPGREELFETPAPEAGAPGPGGSEVHLHDGGNARNGGAIPSPPDRKRGDPARGDRGAVDVWPDQQQDRQDGRHGLAGWAHYMVKQKATQEKASRRGSRSSAICSRRSVFSEQQMQPLESGTTLPESSLVMFPPFSMSVWSIFTSPISFTMTATW